MGTEKSSAEEIEIGAEGGKFFSPQPSYRNMRNQTMGRFATKGLAVEHSRNEAM